MVDHVNFYENLQEATMRLNRTVVMYDNNPYYVRGVTDHKGDGVFRIYLEPLEDSGGTRKSSSYAELREVFDGFGSNSAALGAQVDAYLAANKDCPVLRKKLNSPAFNRFRPFPLGMYNAGEKGSGRCYYVERTPQRHREQGLTAGMCIENRVTCGENMSPGRAGGLNYVNMYGPAFADTIRGKYPSAKECLEALVDPDVTNEAIAFDRKFAFVRGPLDMLFLGYKDNVIGILMNHDLSVVQLGKKFKHLKEVTNELSLFGEVRVK